MKTLLVLLGLASALLFGCGDSNRGTGVGAPDDEKGSNGDAPAKGAADAGLAPPDIDMLALTSATPTVSDENGQQFYIYQVSLSFHDRAEVVTRYGIQGSDGSDSSIDLPATDQSELQTDLPLAIGVSVKSMTGPIVVSFTVYGESGAASMPASVTLDPPSQ